MSTTEKPKAKRYRIKQGKGGLTPIGLGYTVTEEMLNGPKGDLFIRHLSNYEKERGVSIFGTLIVLE